MSRQWAILLCCVVASMAPVGTTAAEASDPDQLVGMADSAFRQGDYPRAAQLGRAAGTARGRTVAAWAGLVEGKFVAPSSERMPDILRAEQDARQALALDAADVEGHLALVIALGFIGRQEGGVAAHFEGIAREARQHIDLALALAPRNAWANALLGGWNLEIVYDGGALGRQIYGASLQQGIDAYGRALAIDPDNSPIAYQYALELLALDGASHHDRARRLLTDIVTRPPGDALDALIRVRAFAAMGALDADDDDRVASLVREELGGPP